METVLRFEAERDDPGSEFMAKARARDAEKKRALDAARARLTAVRYGPGVIDACARVADAFDLVGHRGDLVLGRAARALAAIEGAPMADAGHVARVAKLVLVHRRGRGESGTLPPWTADDDARVARTLPNAEG
ncbi:hypothetical protein DEH69_16125 [Streptomyces sp. PT12]|nr:hypothetical protein DEH69_16125 [Streptomyces sp. PT12]